MMQLEFRIERAAVKDAEKILGLQKLAYISEAEIIDDFTIPPLRQTLDEILFEFSRQIVLKVESGGDIIGSVRVSRDGETCRIGKLIVHPDHQNIGIGTRLLQAAQEQFPEVKRYELFTGEKSLKNLSLYKKIGYRTFKTETVSAKLTLVFLEKFSGVSG